MIIFGTPTENNDWIIGDDADDLISGLDGDDFIVGNGGTDRLYGNDGDDTFVPGLGKDLIWGGFRTYDSGNDTVNYSGYAGGVFVDLGNSYGYLKSLGNNDRDSLHGIENAVGSAYDDELHGDGKANVLRGRDGSDSLYGRAGNDSLYGGDDDDILRGDAGNDDLHGDAGDDHLRGGAGADELDGGAGLDTASYLDSPSRVVVNLASGTGLFGDAAGDSIMNVENVYGSEFDDVLTGDAGANILVGAGGDDILNGGMGNDIIVDDGDGDDRISGGGGDDLMAGGVGRDMLAGGAGADSFVLGWIGDSGPTAATSDVITDFNSVQGDKVHLSYLDADETLADDQAFAFIGTSGFSNTAGELRFGSNGGNTVVQGDVDGDGVADFSVMLSGNHTLTADDFIL